jgi:peptide/nickel transport system permease protein
MPFRIDTLRRHARQALRSPTLVAGVALLLCILAVAICAGSLFRDGPFDMVAPPFIWPGQDPQHYLGTDSMGRDILTGLAFGARVSLAIGFGSALIAVLIGVTVGALGGYFGGWTDKALSRATEVVQTMPSLILAVVLVALIGPTLPTIVMAISLTSWPQVARLMRAEVLRVRASEYVQAARVMRMTHLQIILRHVLPNTLAPVIVAGSVLVATSILAEAALSFLGLGDPNQMSWGAMVGNGRDALRTAWYITALPGTAIALTVIAFSLVGNGLNDLLNPRRAQE